MNKVHQDGCDLEACALFKCVRCERQWGECHGVADTDEGEGEPVDTSEWCDGCFGAERNKRLGLCIVVGCEKKAVPMGSRGETVLCEEHWNGAQNAAADIKADGT